MLERQSLMLCVMFPYKNCDGLKRNENEEAEIVCPTIMVITLTITLCLSFWRPRSFRKRTTKVILNKRNRYTVQRPLWPYSLDQKVLV